MQPRIVFVVGNSLHDIDLPRLPGKPTNPGCNNLTMTHRWKPSVTVAAVMERDGRYLLIEEHTPEGLRLNNPAGHLELGESLVQACAREALEETAHTFTPGYLVGVYLARFQRPGATDPTEQDITYLRFAFGGSLAIWTPVSSGCCGSAHRKCAPRWRSIAAPWCCSASRTTCEDNGIRSTCCTPTTA